MVRDVVVRPATADDLSGVLGVLDAGALETDAEAVRTGIHRGDAFVAVRGSASGAGDASGTVLGALVLVDCEGPAGAEIDAVAVRRRRRGQGIGRALVAAAADRYDRLVAEFDAGVRPFYESLGFEIEPTTGDEPDRYRGVLCGAIPQEDG
ncbi:GNAT family N-acetyltransferase [Halosimplex halophilum]|uniref:GNAT family N-acetyltransferase n=1 Tax=Halosimplex halophilum TaxID=2559572 RepID=UPI00107F62E4|nr:GNAT family N-acetyltransferase [Halosimplex halophilum]